MQPHTCSEIQKLDRLCRELGGRLERVLDRSYERLMWRPDFYPSPFEAGCLGVFWRTTRVIYSTDEIDIHWASILHEMGHVFAYPEPPVDGVVIDEMDFFGWEYAVVRHIGASVEEWLKENADYVAVPGRDLGEMDEHERRRALQWACSRAQERGVVDLRGRPLSVRGGGLRVSAR